MTNEDRQKALGTFNKMMVFIHDVVTRCSGSWHENDFLSKGELETIRKALAPVEVDVEKLKKPIVKNGSMMHSVMPMDYNRREAIGWNDCIDHLSEQGVLSQGDGWRDVPPIEQDDGKEKLFGLFVNDHLFGKRRFEYYPLILDDEGTLRHPGIFGDYFTEWEYSDFTHVTPAPLPPRNKGE